MAIEGQTDFELAEQVMAAAMYVSEHKPSHVGSDRVDGLRHEEFLHELATKMAGDRVKELYPDEE